MQVVGRKRKSSEIMNGGPTSHLPQLDTSEITPLFFPNQKAESVEEHRPKRKKRDEDIAALEQTLESMTAAPSATSSVPPEATCPIMQAKGRGLTMGWSALPPDLEEQILCNMTLLELARVSTTCRAFQASFRRQVSALEEAHWDMAARCFGPKWITWSAGLADRFLKGEPLDSSLKQGCVNLCSLSAEGLLEVEEVSYGVCQPETRSARRVRVRLSSKINIQVPAPNCCWMSLLPSRENGGLIIVFPQWGYGEDVEGVAFVHALFTWGLATTLRDAHPHVNIGLHRCSSLDGGRTFGPTAYLAQISPLSALATRDKWDIKPWAVWLGPK